MKTIARFLGWAWGYAPVNLDLVGGYFPSIEFGLALRKKKPQDGIRQGAMTTCPNSSCNRTFIRTAIDPKEEQLCPVCRLDKTEFEKRPTVKARPHVVR